VVLPMVPAVSLGIGLSASGRELRMNTHDSNARRSRVSWPGLALAAFVSLAAGADLDAQTAAPQEPRFEVVSIKRSAGGGARSMMAVQPSGRVSVRNLPVQGHPAGVWDPIVPAHRRIRLAAGRAV
jgi:hypothetical protein